MGGGQHGSEGTGFESCPESRGQLGNVVKCGCCLGSMRGLGEVAGAGRGRWMVSDLRVALRQGMGDGCWTKCRVPCSTFSGPRS